MTLLLAERIEKFFGSSHVLKGISLCLQKGRSIAIIGKSGAGKSTLLSILGLLEKPSKGSVELLGTQVPCATAAATRNRHIGFVFQFHHLLEDESALYNVLLPANIARLPLQKGSPAHARALALLDSMHMLPYKDTSVKYLSGGEKQRIAIARALCNTPELILADEPSGNLDRSTSEGVHSLLLDLCRKEQQGLIIATHDEKLAALCDEIYLLENGLLCQI